MESVREEPKRPERLKRSDEFSSLKKVPPGPKHRPGPKPALRVPQVQAPPPHAVPTLESTPKRRKPAVAGSHRPSAAAAAAGRSPYFAPDAAKRRKHAPATPIAYAGYGSGDRARPVPVVLGAAGAAALAVGELTAPFAELELQCRVADDTVRFSVQRRGHPWAEFGLDYKDAVMFRWDCQLLKLRVAVLDKGRPRDRQNNDRPNPDRPNTNRPSIDRPSTDRPNPDRPGLEKAHVRCLLCDPEPTKGRISGRMIFLMLNEKGINFDGTTADGGSFFRHFAVQEARVRFGSEWAGHGGEHGVMELRVAGAQLVVAFTRPGDGAAVRRQLEGERSKAGGPRLAGDLRFSDGTRVSGGLPASDGRSGDQAGDLRAAGGSRGASDASRGASGASAGASGGLAGASGASGGSSGASVRPSDSDARKRPVTGGLGELAPAHFYAAPSSPRLSKRPKSASSPRTSSPKDFSSDSTQEFFSRNSPKDTPGDGNDSLKRQINPKDAKDTLEISENPPNNHTDSLDPTSPSSPKQTLEIDLSSSPASPAGADKPSRRVSRQARRQINLAQASYDTVVEPTKGDVQQLAAAGYAPLSYRFWDGKSLRVNLEDIVRLNPQIYLNDNIIWFYLKLYLERLRQRDPGRAESIIMLDTFFYYSMRSAGAEPVQPWVAKLPFDKKPIVFLPIHESSHWALAMILGLDRALQAAAAAPGRPVEPKPTILVLDSLGPARTYNTMRKVVTALSVALRAQGRPALSRTDYRLVKADIPTQDNLTDCGVFLLHYVEQILERLPYFLRRVYETDERNLAFGPEFWRADDLGSKRTQFKHELRALAQSESNQIKDEPAAVTAARPNDSDDFIEIVEEDSRRPKRKRLGEVLQSRRDNERGSDGDLAAVADPHKDKREEEDVHDDNIDDNKENVVDDKEITGGDEEITDGDEEITGGDEENTGGDKGKDTNDAKQENGDQNMNDGKENTSDDRNRTHGKEENTNKVEDVKEAEPTRVPHEDHSGKDSCADKDSSESSREKGLTENSPVKDLTENSPRDLTQNSPQKDSTADNPEKVTEGREPRTKLRTKERTKHNKKELRLRKTLETSDQRTQRAHSPRPAAAEPSLLIENVTSRPHADAKRKGRQSLEKPGDPARALSPARLKSPLQPHIGDLSLSEPSSDS